jgi:hypothetical protein
MLRAALFTAFETLNAFKTAASGGSSMSPDRGASFAAEIIEEPTAQE